MITPGKDEWTAVNGLTAAHLSDDKRMDVLMRLARLDSRIGKPRIRVKARSQRSTWIDPNKPLAEQERDPFGNRFHRDIPDLPAFLDRRHAKR